MSAPVHGLARADVDARRAAHGTNVLTPPPRDPWWKQFLEKFDDPVIRILIIAAGLAIGIGALKGEVAAEGVGIVVAIFLATFLAFWNEFRANKEFDVLNKSNDDVPVKVVRDGVYTTVPRRDVVVGDTVLVEIGEEVPADGRLTEAVSLQVNESRLTGEAKPANKSVGPADAAAKTAYDRGELLRGTTVVDGYGTFEVAAVGDRTEIGKTLRESIEENQDVSPLNRQLGELSKVIGVVGFGIAVLTFAALISRAVLTGDLTMSAGQWLAAGSIAAGLMVAMARVWLPIAFDALEITGVASGPPGWLEANGAVAWLKTFVAGAVVAGVGLGAGVASGRVSATPADWLPPGATQEFLQAFMIAVTIIVVAVPEGLAMSVTLSLAYSMRKMTASNNLVRRMDACETIGAATVICSDKTGTLTLNEMRVFAADVPTATGTGLPTDSRLHDLVIEAVSANTTAHLSREPDKPVTPVGNPTEGALLLWLDAAGANYITARTAFAVRTQWTFTTERKFMATVGRSAVLGQDVLYVKGAPEMVLGRCSHKATAGDPTPLTGDDRAAIGDAMTGFQTRGMRTLGLAYRTHPADGTTAEELAEGMVWLGFVAIADPVRADVPAAIAACRAAGVGVKIITGDSPATAREIARQAGLWDEHDTDAHRLTGPEFAEMSDERAATAVAELKVLARARPADKLRLVSLLKRSGQVVAVTGDGVNDGPALNNADVGLAMGKTGTSVAKEASDIILLDDSFSSIVTAIRWGRGLYENIQRFILFQLTINVAALGIALLGPFIGFELPLTVMQMLWVNLIMDTFAALALATEPPHEGVLRRPPRRADAFIVTWEMAINLFGVGLLFLVVLVGMILYMKSNGLLAGPNEPPRGETVLFTTFVLLQFWNLFNAKCMGKTSSVFPSLFDNPSFLAVAGMILLGQLLIVQFGGAIFRTTPLSLAEWVVMFGATSIVLWVGEAVRFVRRVQSKDVP